MPQETALWKVCGAFWWPPDLAACGTPEIRSKTAAEAPPASEAARSWSRSLASTRPTSAGRAKSAPGTWISSGWCGGILLERVAVLTGRRRSSSVLARPRRRGARGERQLQDLAAAARRLARRPSDASRPGATPFQQLGPGTSAGHRARRTADGPAGSKKLRPDLALVRQHVLGAARQVDPDVEASVVEAELDAGHQRPARRRDLVHRPGRRRELELAGADPLEVAGDLAVQGRRAADPLGACASVRGGSVVMLVTNSSSGTGLSRLR